MPSSGGAHSVHYNRTVSEGRVIRSGDDFVHRNGDQTNTADLRRPTRKMLDNEIATRRIAS